MLVTEAAAKKKIQTAASDLGFDLCRFTDGRPPRSAHHFQSWLAKGYQAEMGYLARHSEKRCEPSLVLPEIRSIITLATSYHTENSQDGLERCDRDRGRGVVARYARFRDYHDVLAEKLTALTRIVTRSLDEESQALWYVDTGPILERDLAQRSGIGFVGKHTNLISRQLGNWFFLSEILTTLRFPPDEPENNRCGKCQRCLEACPTDALPKPFELNARRCISYLTIELKGSIPVSLRPLIGARIFGCDDCLAICPWNRFAKEGRLMKAHALDRSNLEDLESWTRITPEDFRAKFRETPFYRTKWRGLLRNVCVALGNVGDITSLPSLERLRTQSEPMVAEHAVWAIAQIEARARAPGQPD